MRKLQKSLASGLLIMLLLSPIIGYSQQTGKTEYTDDTNFPKGKMGVVLQNFINTINQNDSSKVREFIENNYTTFFQNIFPMKDHQDFFLSLYQQTGGLGFYSIRSFTSPQPDKTVVIFKDEKYNLWYSFPFTFADKKDYLIKEFGFSYAETPSNLNKPIISDSELAEKANEIIDRLCKKDIFSGAILIAKGEKVLYQKACGEASKSFHIANNLDTKFNIASMNKMFTSIAVMQLVEKGIINLDDPISKYVDESWLPTKITNKVTIRHLLSHTSGLGDYFNSTYWKSSHELFRMVDDFKTLVNGDTLAFEPGTNFSYSNTGMLLLGVVIQKATGMDYFEYIRKNIYKPTAMVNSDSYDMDQPVENLAIGYSPTSNNKYGWENNIYKFVIKGGPAGGGFSTVGDLHHFALALINRKLVSSASQDLLWTDHSKSDYGYGFDVRMGSKGKVIGHNGGFTGVSSDFDIFMDSGYIVVILSNYSDVAHPVERLINQLICRLKD